MHTDSGIGVGSRLRDLRARKKWTQERLADEADVSVGTVTLIESGRRMPNVITQQKLAEALRVERTELFPEDEEVAS